MSDHRQWCVTEEDMVQQPAVELSVSALTAEREARQAHEHATERQLKQQEQEHLADYRKRLEAFQITEANRHSIVDKIRRAFDVGESEVMFMSFPSSFCTDGGRAIGNAGEPPINAPRAYGAGEAEPDWLATLPVGLRSVYGLWKEGLKPGGFGFGARIISFPDGKPGDVGLFFTWPKN
jgi:hypothetical protein